METNQEERRRHPWFWVPSLYFAQGIPYVVATTVSLAMYKSLGISNTKIGIYTSFLGLPWVIKPLWSPVVDLVRTKRWWIVTMQFFIVAALALAASVVSIAGFFFLSLAIFGMMALASATHDIAADGFYMLGMPQHEQAMWVGVRSAAFRAAMLYGSGVLVLLAGVASERSGDVRWGWQVSLAAAAAVFFIFAVWHWFVLPRPANDGPVRTGHGMGAEFFLTFGAFFRKPGVGMALAFILLYRLDEAQLSRVNSFFFLDKREAGGLALGLKLLGYANVTGVVALTCGGLLGGFTVARFGLKRMLPIMAGVMYLPKIAYIYLSWAKPESFGPVCGVVALEQFGYGFGFAAFMLYMLHFADGPHRTAHYAICTGFMALGMMIPGTWSGLLADKLGYEHFFIWVVLSALPGFTCALLLKVDPNFGRKT